MPEEVLTIVAMSTPYGASAASLYLTTILGKSPGAGLVLRNLLMT